MTILSSSIQNAVPFDCPLCGESVDLGRGNTYCPHVVFIWVWGDPNGWVYARNDFAQDFIRHLREKDSLRDEDDVFPEDDFITRFVKGEFEPFDETSIAVPFHEKVIEELADKIGLQIYEDQRTYSGVVIGISGTLDQG
jgi:hypothetical protein